MSHDQRASDRIEIARLQRELAGWKHDYGLATEIAYQRLISLTEMRTALETAKEWFEDPSWNTQEEAKEMVRAALASTPKACTCGIMGEGADAGEHVVPCPKASTPKEEPCKHPKWVEPYDDVPSMPPMFQCANQQCGLLMPMFASTPNRESKVWHVPSEPDY